jgi:ADP-ribose pyrophosphatase
MAERWTRRNAHLLLDREPWLRVFADDVELPDGRRVDGFLRVEGLSYAMVFALTDDRQVLFLRQYKYGPDAVVLELPAGYLEPGEAPEAGARRELLEETGYGAARWEPLGSFYVDGNRGFGRAHLFLARGARAVQPAASGDLEEMRVELVPLAGVAALFDTGEVQGLAPAACAALALLRLNGADDRRPTTDG